MSFHQCLMLRTLAFLQRTIFSLPASSPKEGQRQTRFVSKSGQRPENAGRCPRLESGGHDVSVLVLAGCRLALSPFLCAIQGTVRPYPHAAPSVSTTQFGPTLYSNPVDAGSLIQHSRATVRLEQISARAGRSFSLPARHLLRLTRSGRTNAHSSPRMSRLQDSFCAPEAQTARTRGKD